MLNDGKIVEFYEQGLILQTEN